MKQTLTMKGRSLMLAGLFALSLAALIMLSGAASKAEATTNTVLQQLGGDGKLNSNMSEQLKAQNRFENSSGAATASPSAPATTASPSTPATRDQYGPVPDTDGKATGPVPDTGGKAAAPAQTGKAKEGPDTGGRAAAPAETTEATGLPAPNRNSSALPLTIGSGALLVGGGLLARRLIR